MACLLSLIQYIGETPSNPKLAKMCMKFNFISICTYLCGVFLYIVVLLTTLDPMSLGTMLYLKVVLGTIGDALDACLIHKEEVVTQLNYNWRQARMMD